MLFRITLFTTSVVVGMFLNEVLATDRHKKYTRSNALDGKSCLAADITLYEDADSAISCMTKCIDKPCETIFYDPLAGTCTGCERWYRSAADLPSSSDTKAYRAPEPVPAACGSGEGSYGDSCYTWMDLSTSMVKAQETCATVPNRYLAVPSSQAELNAIISWMGNVFPGFGKAYLGLTDTEVEGTFRTVHGEIQHYFNWKPIEPSGPEDCLTVYSDGLWNDDSCFGNYRALCEKNIFKD